MMNRIELQYVSFLSVFLAFFIISCNAGQASLDFKSQPVDKHTILMLHFDEGNEVVIKDSSGKLPVVALQPLAEGQSPTWPREGARGNGLLTTNESWGGFTMWSESDVSDGSLMFNFGYVVIPSFSGLLNASEGTIEAWVCPQKNDIRNGIGGIISLGNKPAIFVGPVKDDGFVNLSCQWDGLAKPVFDAGTLKINEWSHVALVWVDSTRRVYVNGQLRGEAQYDSEKISFSEDVYTVGSYKANRMNYFTGMIDEVRVSNIARAIDDFIYDPSFKKPDRSIVPSVEQVASWQSTFDYPEGQVSPDKSFRFYDNKEHVANNGHTVSEKQDGLKYVYYLEKLPPLAYRILGDKGPDRPRTVPEDWVEVEKKDLANVLDQGISAHITPGNAVSYTVSKSPENLSGVDMNDPAGFIVFARHYDDAVYKDTRPFANEISPVLKIFAARNEFEPVTFSIRSLSDLNDVEVEVSHLINEEGNVLGNENIEVRSVRYFRHKVCEGKFTLLPKTLEKRLPMDIEKGVTQRFWLTIYVSKFAEPGLYAGNITVSSKDKSAKLIPIRLRVLPFELGDSEMGFGSFFLGRFEGCLRSQNIYQDNFQKIFNFYRDHGLNTILLFEVNPKMAYRDGKVTVDMKEIDHLVKNYQGADLNKPIYLDVRSVAVWCDELGGKIADEVEKTGKEPENVPMHQNFKYTPKWGNDYEPNKYTKKVYKQAIARIMQYGKERDWPEIYFGAEEELKHTLGKFIGYDCFYKLIREVPGAQLCLVDDSPLAGIDRCQRYDDIDPDNVNWRVQHDLNPKIIENAHKSGDKFYYYNYGWGRYPFGWNAIATGVDGVIQWADQWSDDDPYADFPRHSWFFCYPSLKGPIPTIWSEATREGIDDIRYVQTLRKLITKAKVSKDKRAIRIAEEAEKYIDSITSKIPVTSKLRDLALQNTTKRDLDIIRWKIGTEIVKLQGFKKEELSANGCNSKRNVWGVDYFMLCFDELDIVKMINDAHDAGVDTLLWRVSALGQMTYPSKAATACHMGEQELKQAADWHKLRIYKLEDMFKRGVDPLEVAIRQCRKKGMKIYVYVSIFDDAAGWHEDNEVTNPAKLRYIMKSEFTKQNPELMLVDREGNRSLGILCYAYKRAREFRVNQIREITEYEPDGIFLEQRSHSGGFLDALGFNPPIVTEYRKRTGGKSPYDENFDRKLLMDINGDFLTQLYGEIADVVHEAGQKLAIGISFDDYTVHAVNNMREMYLEGIDFIESYSRSIHLDWKKWVNDGICDILVVGAGGLTIWNIPWDDIFRDRYLPTTNGKAELWVWLRLYGDKDTWGSISPGAAKRTFRDAAEATSVNGVVWYETAHWYRDLLTNKAFYQYDDKEMGDFIWNLLHTYKNKQDALNLQR